MLSYSTGKRQGSEEWPKLIPWVSYQGSARDGKWVADADMDGEVRWPKEELWYAETHVVAYLRL